MIVLQLCPFCILDVGVREFNMTALSFRTTCKSPHTVEILSYTLVFFHFAPDYLLTKILE